MPDSSPAPLLCQLSTARTFSAASATRCSSSQPSGYSKAPTTAYTASLVISAFLMSTLYLSTLLRPCLPLLGISSRLAMFVAFMYLPLPATALTRQLRLGRERLYAGLHAPGRSSFGTLLQRKSVRAALIFGLLLGYMYTIHSRSLPLLPIAAFFLLAFGLVRISGIGEWLVLH